MRIDAVDNARVGETIDNVEVLEGFAVVVDDDPPILVVLLQDALDCLAKIVRPAVGRDDDAHDRRFGHAPTLVAWPEPMLGIRC